MTIVQVSGNAGRLVGIAAEELVGLPVDRLVAHDDLQPLRRALLDGTLTAQPLYLLTVHAPPGGTPFDALAHRHDGLVLLELEPAGRHANDAAGRLYQTVQAALRRVEAAPSLPAMGEVVAAEVRRLSGFDRVMVYRFDADHNGAVVAEARRDDLEPLLGLHYPASDIPAQARDLYLRNRLRFIPDRDYVPSPLVRHLVELHGGTVEASSDGQGNGATFVVKLPLKAPDPPPTDQPAAEGGPAAKPAARGSAGRPDTPAMAGLRVLVVTTAEGVDGALAAIAAGRFDAIVSDVGMPGRDGYDLIRAVRSLPPDAGGETPAVALTALARAEDRRRALQAGFQVHIPKPVHPAELLAVVAGPGRSV